MRIIAGRFKGRVLHSFKGRNIRPTSDRLRETLFNILQKELSGASVWDAFAGTGALGLEALSRGAGFVLFTERSRQAVKLLLKNVNLLGITGETEVIHADAIDWVATTGHRFDIIFLDPPYDFRSYVDLARAIGAARVCNPAGTVVLEHYKVSSGVEKLVETCRPYRQVHQGDSVLSFFSEEEFTLAQR